MTVTRTALPLINALQPEDYMSQKNETANGAPTPATEPPKARFYKDAGWKFRRDGQMVYGENMRRTYEARLGEVYISQHGEDGLSKRLDDVAMVGDEWFASLAPTEKTGRRRLVPLDQFFVRYVEGTVKPAKQERPTRAPSASQAQLDRVEAKLDTLLTLVTSLVPERGC